MDFDDLKPVNFNTAMGNFARMFPRLEKRLIEQILRKHNGDVADTVDELLKISEETEKQGHSKENTDNDFAYAAMLQNQEFLSYLKTQSAFQQATHHRRRARRHGSYNRYENEEYERNYDYSRPSSSRVSYNEEDYQKNYIPNGPLVDPCETPRSRLLKKFIPKINKKQSATKPEDLYPHTVIVDYVNGDERSIQKLKNMGEASKQLLSSVAKKFLAEKTLKLRPTED
ncbi:unnamed protein product [Bursaphelenchus xylophilus]|uniref:(pine wood nematode) hypothetical protein n=1 Tax=Bursaphelenchus xylophilus TaxID=6326 RepID=A0A1I7SUG4_BURXY|nr:unnamed protein product [Bursaphelenchus xylophilus]CAG9107160.1 unnamed protein product [Bursaphelenchus xylophilus]